MYTMKQVCEEANMTYQTLKYYCNEGLIPNVKRDDNNHRVFNERDVKWIKDLYFSFAKSSFKPSSS